MGIQTIEKRVKGEDKMFYESLLGRRHLLSSSIFPGASNCLTRTLLVLLLAAVGLLVAEGMLEVHAFVL